MIMRTIFASLLFVAITACGDDAPDKTPNGESCEASIECESFAVDEEKGGCWEELTDYNPFFGETTYILEGGICSILCEWSETGTLDERARGTCYEQEYCLAYGTSEAICFQGCDDENLCREDYECTALNSGLTVCLPPEDSARVISDDLVIAPAYTKATK